MLADMWDAEGPEASALWHGRDKYWFSDRAVFWEAS